MIDSLGFLDFVFFLEELTSYLVDTGGLYKIVPEADAKLQGNPVNAGPVSALAS